MKNLHTLLLILSAAMFFTACEKEESLENYNSISGVLTVGENVTTDDLNEITVCLAKLNEGIAPASVSFADLAAEYITETKLTKNGGFAFSNLDYGNYVLLLSDNYIFSIDTFLTAIVNGNNRDKIKNSIKRIEVSNFIFNRTTSVGPYFDDMDFGNYGPSLVTGYPTSLNSEEIPYGMLIYPKCANLKFEYEFYQDNQQRYELSTNGIHRWSGSLVFNTGTKSIRVRYGDQKTPRMIWPRWFFESYSYELTFEGTTVKIKFKKSLTGCYTIIIE